MFKTLLVGLTLSVGMSAFASIEGNWAGDLTLTYANDEQEQLGCHFEIVVSDETIEFNDVDECTYMMSSLDRQGDVLLKDGTEIGTFTENGIEVHTVNGADDYTFSAQLDDDGNLQIYEVESIEDVTEILEGTMTADVKN